MTIAAATTTAGHSSSTGSLFFLVIIGAFVVLWLVVVRPQRRRQNQQRQQASNVSVGDEVLTAGGVYGTVTRIDDDEIRVEIAPKTEVRVARRAVAAVLTEHAEPEPADEPEPDDDERWQSAFDEAGSDEEKPG